MVANLYDILQTRVAKLIFPAKKKDWYKRYEGNNTIERFNNFLRLNQENELKDKEKSYYYKEFSQLEPIKRQFINAKDTRGNKLKLDSIELTPKSTEGKLGVGQHIINFFGVGEYYECNFSDMAKQADASGATIHAFNPPGMNCSSGKVHEFNDLVNAGIAMVNSLLVKGVHPKDIVLQGNCLGSSVAEGVHKSFANEGIELRRINSNSFKSIKSMIMSSYSLPDMLEGLVKKLLQYTGWEVKPGKDFAQTGPFAVYMHREGDQTIASESKLHNKLEGYKTKQKQEKYPNLEIQEKQYQDYREDREFLDQHALMTSKAEYKSEKINPHELDLYKMQSVHSEKMSSYDFVNEYLSRSSRWINHHPEIYNSYNTAEPKKATYLKPANVINKSLQEEAQLFNTVGKLEEHIQPYHERAEKMREAMLPLLEIMEKSAQMQQRRNQNQNLIR